MQPYDFTPYINAFAPFVLASVSLLLLGRFIGRQLPFAIPWRALGWIGAIAVAFLAAKQAVAGLATCPPRIAMGVGLGLSFVAFLIRRHLLSADARKLQADRLRQARAQERRRVPAPLPAANRQTTQGALRQTTGTP